MKNIFIVTFFFAVCQVSAKPFPGEIKGVYNEFKAGYEHLSPLLAIPWVEGGVLENLHELSSIKSKSVVVIRDIFTRIDEDNFLPSTAASKISSHLNNFLIGQLAYHLERVRRHEDRDVKNIKLTSSREKKGTDDAKKEFVEFLLKLVVTNPKFAKSRDNLKAQFKQAQSQLLELEAKKGEKEKALKDPSLEKQEKARVKGEIDALIIKINRIRSLDEGSSFEKNLQRILRTMVEAAMEHDPNISIFKVLNALVYHKSSTKNGYYNYFRGIVYAANSTKHSNTSAIKILKDPQLFYNLANIRWVKDVYTDKQAEDKTRRDYEIRVYRMLKLQGNWLTPYLTGFSKVTLKSGTEFYDCGERSLLNLFLILFANQKSMSIDVALLKKVITKPHPALLKFFETYTDLEMLRTHEASGAWAEVVSNIHAPGKKLLYARNSKEERCEIEVGFRNMEVFISVLSGLPSLDALVQSYNRHSNDNIIIEKKLNMPKHQDDMGIITVKRGALEEFEWHFEERHFRWVSLGEGILKKETIEYLLNQHQPLLDLVALALPSKENAKVLKIAEKSREEKSDYFMFLNPLRNDDQIFDFFKIALDKHIFSEDQIILSNIMKKIRHIDTHMRICRNMMDSVEHFNVKKSYLDILKRHNKLSILDSYNYAETGALLQNIIFINFSPMQEGQIVKQLLPYFSDNIILSMFERAIEGRKEDILRFLLDEIDTNTLIKIGDGLDFWQAYSWITTLLNMSPDIAGTFLKKTQLASKMYDGQCMLQRWTKYSYNSTAAATIARHMDENCVNLVAQEGLLLSLLTKELKEPPKNRRIDEASPLLSTLISRFSQDAIDAVDKNGLTALHLALLLNLEDVACLLINKMSKQGISKKGYSEDITALLECHFKALKHKFTALQLAVCLRQTRAADLLIDKMDPQDLSEILHCENCLSCANGVKFYGIVGPEDCRYNLIDLVLDHVGEKSVIKLISKMTRDALTIDLKCRDKMIEKTANNKREKAQIRELIIKQIGDF